MKLTELDGHFLYPLKREGHLWDKGSRRGPGALRRAWGVVFQCPRCAVGKPKVYDSGDRRHGIAGAHYIRVHFANPAGSPVCPESLDDNPRWAMSGTSIEDLTLMPSINLDIAQRRDGKFIPESERGCRWHGYVRNGSAE